ncbi:Periplasmic binding protein [Pseudomonas savastanoi pv. retacarpa]|nr:Periplasmic binding protein [Pseudomonas savastanoi pv. retacarpa]RMN59952.1 Periplasmic binding protein [Pseudomonas savastanoi pv. savastanoi]
MLVNTARVALLTIAVSVAQSAFASTAQPVDLSPDRQRIHVPRNEAAIAQIPAGFKFAQPGKFTVAVSGVAGPPLALLANDDKTTIGSEADTAQLVADSLGLQLNVVQTSWEDWPLGVSSGKYDAVISNVTVTEARKKRFDFATYRQDVLGFYVKTNSKISEIKQASDIAGLKIIVGSGTNQEKVLLVWNEANEKAVSSLRCCSISMIRRLRSLPFSRGAVMRCSGPIRCMPTRPPSPEASSGSARLTAAGHCRLISP